MTKRLTPTMAALLRRLETADTRLVMWFTPTSSARLMTGNTGEPVPLATAQGVVNTGRLVKVEGDGRRAIYEVKQGNL